MKTPKPSAPRTETIRTKVHGMTFANPDGTSRQEIIRRYCRDGMPLAVVPEPRNRYDRNALGLWVQARGWFSSGRSYQIGYVSSEWAAELKPYLKRGATITARILDVTGGDWFKDYGVNIEITIEG